jgi:FAD:protein FMN transferase
MDGRSDRTMKTTLERSPSDEYWIGRFQAMASPCELFVEIDDRETAAALLQAVAAETWRIETKFSRYRKDNLIHRINTSNGNPIEVDEETALLLNFADQCYQLSEGLFDITAGVLRKVWEFRPGARLPKANKVSACLQQVGWDKVQWQAPFITLPPGMEIDLGGIGKEYAVDKAAQLLSQQTDASFIVNFGGDLYINKPRRNNQAWRIGIDDPEASGRKAVGQLEVRMGGVATSGDARRFIKHKGKRYSHILNPKTGWPVENAPHSVTVVASNCMEAGMLATFAMLQGSGAATFLEAQQVHYWLA